MRGELYLPPSIWLRGLRRHFACVAYLSFAGSFLFPLGAHTFAGRVRNPRIFHRLGTICLVAATVIGCVLAVLSV